MSKLDMPKMYDAVTVGERGQVVIPAQIRRLLSIKAGDKLVVFAKGGGHIGLIPSEQFSHFLEQITEISKKIKHKIKN